MAAEALARLHDTEIGRELERKRGRTCRLSVEILNDEALWEFFIEPLQALLIKKCFCEARLVRSFPIHIVR